MSGLICKLVVCCVGALSLAMNHVLAAGLNDTGVTSCVDAAGATVSCTSASAVIGQDARYGRDAAADSLALPKKTGNGAGGFDFSKIGRSGQVVASTSVLGSGPNDWVCTYDNVTGLMWEVAAPNTFRAMVNVNYTWLDSDPETNGGAAGVSNGGTCGTNRCDTEKYVADVNATNLCGHSDWRLPTVRELVGLKRFGTSPSVDTQYFPHTNGWYYWTSSPSASQPSSAWVVSFDGPSVIVDSKGAGYYMRLVRVGR